MKFILDMTDEEILKEISDILKYKAIFPPKNMRGVLLENPHSFFKDGNNINKKELFELYNYNENLEKYIVTLSITSLRSRKPDLFSLIRSQKKGNKVLDLGCGVSTHGIACAQLGCDVHILDISIKLLAFALIRYQKRDLRVISHNDYQLVPRRYFDAIICSDVIEHVHDPINVLKYIIVWLKPRGIVHLHVATSQNLRKGHLPQAVNAWKRQGVHILKRRFKQISPHNYQLRA